MIETTDLWNGSHSAHRRRLYPARLGRVLLKRQMSPARMIVVDVFAYENQGDVDGAGIYLLTLCSAKSRPRVDCAF